MWRPRGNAEVSVVSWGLRLRVELRLHLGLEAACFGDLDGKDSPSYRFACAHGAAGAKGHAAGAQEHALLRERRRLVGAAWGPAGDGGRRLQAAPPRRRTVALDAVPDGGRHDPRHVAADVHRAVTRAAEEAVAGSGRMVARSCDGVAMQGDDA